MIEVRGKSTRRVRKVYILITSEMRQALDYVLANRAQKTSKYVFTRWVACECMFACYYKMLLHMCCKISLRFKFICNLRTTFFRDNGSYVDGCTVVREITKECPKLKFPSRIRSTPLRKYLASAIQVKSLTR